MTSAKPREQDGCFGPDPLTACEWTGCEQVRLLKRAPTSVFRVRVEAAMKDEIAKLTEPSEYLKELKGPKLAGKAGKFGLSLVKDYSKDELKRLVTEVVESEGFKSFARAQNKLSQSTLELLHTSSQYWRVRDRYEMQLEFHQQLLEQFDPQDHLLVENNEPSMLIDGYSFWLSDRGSDEMRSNERQVRLLVGGVEAKQHKSGALEFTVPYEDLDKIQSDSIGGVQLRVEVLE